MAEERLVQCLDCGNQWKSSAENPRCSDPDDECGRSRNTAPVDELEYDGPVWLLECPDCGSNFDATGKYDECPQCGDHVSPAKIRRLVDGGPDLLDGLGVGDRIAVETNDVDRRLRGEITEVGSGGWSVPDDGASVAIYVEEIDDDPGFRDILVLESTRENAAVDWSPVTALDLDVASDDDQDSREDLGRVTDLDVVESHDPHDMRVEELEDAGLSGREAEVVALKERGYTHAKIAEIVTLPKSTVDEYSRRARKKVKQARALVDAAGEVYQ